MYPQKWVHFFFSTNGCRFFGLFFLVDQWTSWWVLLWELSSGPPTGDFCSWKWTGRKENTQQKMPQLQFQWKLEGYQKKPIRSIRGIIFRDNDGQKRPDFLIGCVALGVVSPENSHGCYVSGTCCSGVFVSWPLFNVWLVWLQVPWFKEKVRDSNSGNVGLVCLYANPIETHHAWYKDSICLYTWERCVIIEL